VVIAIAVVVNILVGTLSLKWDLTSNKLYSLGDVSKKILKDLDKDVTIYGLFDDGKIGSGDYKEVIGFLDQYKKYPHIKIQYVDPDKNPGIIKEIDPNNLKNLAQGDFVVKSGSKMKKLGYYDLFATETDQQTYQENVTGSKTPKYSLYSKDVKPFSVPYVQKSLLVQFVFHIVVTIIFILLAFTAYAFQLISPKKFSEWRAGFSGEESFFDIKDFLIVTGGVFLAPFLDIGWKLYVLLVRYTIVSYMTSKIVHTLNESSDNWPLYFLVNLSWFVNNLEKDIGEFGINLNCSLIFVFFWIAFFIVLIGSLKLAASLIISQELVFIGLVLMDVITLFFVYLGVETGHPLAGALTSMIVGGLILLAPVLGIFFRFVNGKRITRFLHV
jgi:hypothetical protein